MESSRQILGYRVLINLETMGGIQAMIFGKMSGKMNGNILSKIGEHESISSMWCGSLNNMYLLVYLRRISELEELFGFTEHVCGISDPQVVIVGSGSIISKCPSFIDDSKKGDLSSLTELDYKIIRSLHYNARKPIVEIAKETGVSTKTVKKRLSRMIEGNLLDLITLCSIEGSGVLDFDVFVKTRSTDSRALILRKMREDPQFFLVNSWVISNEPNMLYFEIQTMAVNEMNKIVENLRGLNEVASVSADLTLEEHMYDTWRDRLIDQMAFGKGKDEADRGPNIPPFKTHQIDLIENDLSYHWLE